MKTRGLGVFESQQFMAEQGTLLGINGQMSQALLVEFGATLKTCLEDDVTENKIRRKIFSVFIEQMQNIIRYSDERDESREGRNERSWGVLLVGKQQGTYYIKSGNVMNRDKVPAIQRRLDEILALDSAGLKALYHQVRREKQSPSSKGAGLGLIDMARTSTYPLEYAIDDVDEQRVFFSTCVSI